MIDIGFCGVPVSRLTYSVVDIVFCGVLVSRLTYSVVYIGFQPLFGSKTKIIKFVFSASLLSSFKEKKQRFVISE